MKRYLLILCLFATGCLSPVVDVPPSPVPSPDPVSEDLGLDAKVKSVLKGHRDVAEGYYCIYSALADLVTAEKSPFAKPADLESCVEKVQPIMGRNHGEVPEFTSIVETHLKPLAENKPLDANSRAEWSKRLKELAAACKGAL